MTEVTQADNEQTLVLSNWLFERGFFDEDGSPQHVRLWQEFGALADDTFARHREAHTRPPASDSTGDALRERKTLIQNPRVNDAIQTALEKGELTINSEGFLAALSHPSPDEGAGDIGDILEKVDLWSDCDCDPDSLGHERGCTRRRVGQSLRVKADAESRTRAAAIIRSAQPSPDVERMRECLSGLATAEAEYRKLHDLHGDSDMRTGRAWDWMRRKGDAARTALNSTAEGSRGG